MEQLKLTDYRLDLANLFCSLLRQVEFNKNMDKAYNALFSLAKEVCPSLKLESLAKEMHYVFFLELENSAIPELRDMGTERVNKFTEIIQAMQKNYEIAQQSKPQVRPSTSEHKKEADQSKKQVVPKVGVKKDPTCCGNKCFLITLRRETNEVIIKGSHTAIQENAPFKYKCSFDFSPLEFHINMNDLSEALNSELLAHRFLRKIKSTKHLLCIECGRKIQNEHNIAICYCNFCPKIAK